MKIFYSSYHDVLESDFVNLLKELGHDVVSDRRFPEQCGEFDCFIFTYPPENIINYWPKIKDKKVIWVSSGQSAPFQEKFIGSLRKEGLLIVRNSPIDENKENYAGADATIRFYKDPDQFQGWNGLNKVVVNIDQSEETESPRRYHRLIGTILEGLNSEIIRGGKLSQEELKGKLENGRVILYTGFFGSPYTLAFIEAWVTGIPIVSIGKKLRAIEGLGRVDSFEVPDLIKNGVDGFCLDDIGEIRKTIKKLLNDYGLAKRIGEAGREKAISIFGKNKILNQWREFLERMK
jgi:glycosyltransferase involved in cell wall biosynthesis